MHKSVLVRRALLQSPVIILSVLAISCSADAPIATETRSEELVAGRQAEESEYPSTLWLNGCTGAKVGPRHFLTAAHCLEGENGELANDKLPGSTQRLTTMNVLNGTLDSVRIQSAHIYPAYSEACKTEAGCWVMNPPHVPDIGLVIVDRDTPNIPIAEVDPVPVAIGDRVVVGGYGCENGVGQSGKSGRFKLQEVSAGGSKILNHPGSFAPGTRAPGLISAYVITPGLSNDSSAASICPGDSGGPLYRESSDELLVVGVNAYYSFITDGPAGVATTNWHTRVDSDSSYDVLQWLRNLGARIRNVTKETKPLGGTARSISERIEAEDYDTGGQGIGYKDSDKVNNPVAEYRNDAVDIDKTGDKDGAYNIGGVQPGEWLNYSVDVETSGIFTLELRIASPFDGKRLRVELDEEKLSDSIEVPNTGGYQTYTTLTVPDLKLEKGEHVLRLFFESDGFNLNWLNFEMSPPTCTDDVQNGDESDIDCGGACPAKCADEKACDSDADCQSERCEADKCEPKLPDPDPGSSGGAGNGASGSSNSGTTGGTSGSEQDGPTPSANAGAGGTKRISPPRKPSAAASDASCRLAPGNVSRSSPLVFGMFAAGFALWRRRRSQS